MFGNHAPDKDLVSRIYKELLPIQEQKDKPINRYFSKEDTQMASKHMKRCLPLLIIRAVTTT